MDRFAGLVIGFCTFLIIGIFHPLVVKGEYWFGVRVWWGFLLLGVVTAVASLSVDSLIVSVLLGVTAFSSFWSILEVFQQGMNLHSNIAYLAHIGGFAAGCLFMELFLPREIAWSPLDLFLGRKRGAAPNFETRRSAPRKGWSVSPGGSNYKNGPVPSEEIDRILDKLSRNGVNSLSEEEMETLRKAREQMKSPK